MVLRAVAIAAPEVAESKSARCGEALADLVLGERSFRRELRRHNGAGRIWFSQTFGEHAHLSGRHERCSHHAFGHPTEGELEPERQAKHQRFFADDARDAFDSVTQGQFFGPEHGDGFPGERAFGQRRFNDLDDVRDGVGADRSVLKTNEGKYRKSVKRVA